MKDTIATWALYFSIASFALYLATAVAQLIAQLKAIHQGAPSPQAVPNVSGFLTGSRISSKHCPKPVLRSSP